jgi:sec-independent protein translocase protein TatA
MPNLGAPELIVIAVIIIALFGWKKLPDMARSLGRSARVFKSEVDEMKKDGKPSSDASQTTVQSDLVTSDSERLAAENSRLASDNERLAAEARAKEAEARAAQARADADRFRSDPSL